MGIRAYIVTDKGTCLETIIQDALLNVFFSCSLGTKSYGDLFFPAFPSPFDLCL